MKVIKSNMYNIINPEPFEIPLPIVFELLSGNTLLAEYTISEAGVVDYSFNPSTSEKILTSINRPLTMNDIYFLFASRVFANNTPFTALEMERFEVAEYQPYVIIRKTRGMMPGDKYWLRFENEEINYNTALQQYRAYYENHYRKYMQMLEDASKPPEEAQAAAETEPEKSAEPDPDTMTDDMINALMGSISDELEQIDTPESESSGGGMMSDEEIAAMLKQTQEANGVESKMSDDEIAALFAQATGDEPLVPAEPEPEPSNEKMSEDAIAAMLAAAQSQTAGEAPEPMPATPEEETPTSSNEKMSEDAIAAMLAAAQSQTAEEEKHTEEAPAPSNEKMSEDAIAAMLAAANAASEPTEEEKPAEEAPAPSNEKMSDDAIAALLAANNASEPAAEEAPAEEEKPPEETPAPSNEKMSDDAIAALFAQNN